MYPLLDSKMSFESFLKNFRSYRSKHHKKKLIKESIFIVRYMYSGIDTSIFQHKSEHITINSYLVTTYKCRYFHCIDKVDFMNFFLI